MKNSNRFIVHFVAVALTASVVADTQAQDTPSTQASTSVSQPIGAEVDFSKPLQRWDGFGVNYVETAQTRDYRAVQQDYGGFSLMTEAARHDVLEKIFGDAGLKPGVVKMFLDPFHEGYTKEGNDNDNPHVIDLAHFDHTTTTKWMRLFAKEGLTITRARGSDLQIIVTLYGPAPWMTKQKFVRGRDLDPAEKYECAEYMISWAKYLRQVEKLPVRYISLHNEGEAYNRWPADGNSAGGSGNDHNMYWPPSQVVDFIGFMRGMLDEQGMKDVGLGCGETTSWGAFMSGSYAAAIANDPLAIKNLGLITSHGFGSPNEKGIALIREKRPELHAWTTSMSWGKMNAAFVNGIRAQIYEGKVNAVIPWATLQRLGNWTGGDPNPGTAFNVDDEGRVTVKPGYYFYKQVCPAGQPGMAVATVSASHQDLHLMAFASNGTKNPNAFVVINTGNESKPVALQIKGDGSGAFGAWRTSPSEQYAPIGAFKLTGGSVNYTAPAGSVTTFYAKNI